MASNPPRRDGALDLMRGFAIVLVILFHAATVLRADHSVPEWLSVTNAVFAPVRMPAMVFLSGLLVAPSLRRGVAPYMAGKVKRVAWPYLVWSVGFVLLLAVAAPGDKSLSRLLTIPFDPVEHLWFLYYLFAYYIIAILTRWVRAEIIGVGLLTVNVVAMTVGWYDLQVFGFLGFFFFAGVAFSAAPSALSFLLRQKWVMALGVASFGGAVVLGLVAGEVRYAWFLTPFVFFLIMSGLRLARAVDSQRWTTPLKYLGVESIIFYVAHYPVMIVISNLAQRITDSPAILLVAVLVAGVGVPWVLAILVKRAPLTRWLFQFAPSRARTTAAARESF